VYNSACIIVCRIRLKEENVVILVWMKKMIGEVKNELKNNKKQNKRKYSFFIDKRKFSRIKTKSIKQVCSS
jgi:hypothetical protein